MKNIFFFIAVFFSTGINAQIDREFWFAPPFITYFHAAPGNRPLYLRLSAMDLDADVKIEWPAYASSLPVEFTIPARGFRSIRLDSLFVWNGVTGNMSFNEVITFPFGQVTPFGMKISASADITAYYQNDNSFNRELYVLKGNNALGTEFVVPFQNRFNNQYNATTQYDFGSHIDIVASEANTVVTVILPASRTVPRVNPPDGGAGTTRLSEAFTSFSKDIGGPIQYSPGDTFTIVLQAGHSYSIRNRHREYYRHLGGTIIRTNGKKIAVTITDDSVLGNCGCYDIIGDQIVPTNVIGTKYVIMSSKLLNCQVAGDPWLEGWCFVTPSKPNTRILVNGVTWQPSTYVDANNPLGYYYDGPYGPGDCVPVRIPPGSDFIYLESVDHINPTSSDPVDRKPICVLHVAGFGCEMGGAILPPLSCNGSSDISFYRSNRTGESFFMNLMVRDGAENGFKLISSCENGTMHDTVSIPSSWFVKVPGSGIFGDSDATIDRGWWILGDQYKRFGNQMSDVMGGVNLPQPICGLDGDVSDFNETTYSYKNGLPIEVNSATRIINTQDNFHLGIYTGATTSTCQYGYFSNFTSRSSAADIVETGTNIIRTCYGDTITLRAYDGISYEWFYDADGTGTSLTKQYLETGKDKQSICKAFGFIVPDNDTAAYLFFRVKIKRASCLGDTSSVMRVVVIQKILPNITFSDTAICANNPIIITNNTTGANSNRYKYFLKNTTTNINWTDITPSIPSHSPFSIPMNLSFDSTQNDTAIIRFIAQNEHCYKVLEQKIIVRPSVIADFEKSLVSSCGNNSISFTDKSKGITINKHTWHFGDGDSSSLVNPVHMYSSPLVSKDTTYAAKLVVENTIGCSSVAYSNIETHRVLSKIKSVDTSICSPYTNVFVSSIPIADSVEWYIYYGNNASAKINLPDTGGIISISQNISSNIRIDTIVQRCFTFYNKSQTTDLNFACRDSSIVLIKTFPYSLCPDSLIKSSLTINSGIGSGIYKKNEKVTIMADSIENMLFCKWTGDIAAVNDTLAKSSYIIMPGFNVSITANFQQLYSLTISQGTGSGRYLEKSKISIVADSIPGKLFYKWNDIGVIEDPNLSKTFVIMPDSNIHLYAMYKNIHKLTVINGLGGGNFVSDYKVVIEYPTPICFNNCYQFEKWGGDTLYVEDIFSSKTILNMPDTNVTIIALTKKALSNQTDNKKIKIYPNPTSDNIYVSDVLNAKCIELLNVFGEIVLIKEITSNSSTIELDCSNIPIGVYFLKIIFKNNEVFVDKIMKVK